MAEYVFTGVIVVVVLVAVLEPAGGVLQRAMALLPLVLRGETDGPGAGPHRITVVRCRSTAVRAPYFGRPGGLSERRRMLSPPLLFVAAGSTFATSAPDRTTLPVDRVPTDSPVAPPPLVTGPGRERPVPEQSRRTLGTFVGTPTPDLASGGLLTGPAWLLVGGVRAARGFLAALVLGGLALSYFRVLDPTGWARATKNRPGGSHFDPASVALPMPITRGAGRDRTSPLFFGGVFPAVVLLVAQARVEPRAEHPSVVARPRSGQVVASLSITGPILNVVTPGGQSVVVMYLSTSMEVAGYVFGLGVMAHLPWGDGTDAPGLPETGTFASVATRIGYRRTVFLAVPRLRADGGVNIGSAALLGSPRSGDLDPLWLGWLYPVHRHLFHGPGQLGLVFVPAVRFQRVGRRGQRYSETSVIDAGVAHVVHLGDLSTR